MTQLQRTYTTDERIQALVHMARSGSLDKTAEALQIPKSTLADWRNSPDFEEVRRSYHTLVSKHLLEETREVALLELQAEREATHHALERMSDPRLKANELAQIAHNMAKAKGTNIEKLNLMEGKPTSIVEQRDFQTIVKSLTAARLLFDLGDEDVEEITDGS